MFNLIVKAGGWEDGRDDLLLNRVFEHTDDDLIARFSVNRQPDFAQLMALPTLFAQEGQGNEVARVGTVTGARVVGRTVALDYTYDRAAPGVENRMLVELARDLGIGEWELNRTHWAVKNVDVCRVLLQHGPPRRVGPRLFRIAERETIDPTLVSVMMPFDVGFRPVYQALQGLCEALGRQCVRADDIWENDAVMQDVASLIDRSRVVIADCTGRNPNVFYEIGIAHTLGRDVMLITQAVADVPFDLRHLRFVQYLNNSEGLAGLVNGLRRRLEGLV